MGKTRITTTFFVCFVVSGLAISATHLGAQQAQTPTSSPAGESYSSAQSITISDTTTGGTIYYTTDGAMPTTSSAVYRGAIALSTSETLTAIAVAARYTNSTAQSATYTLGGISSPVLVQQCNGYPGCGSSLSCMSPPRQIRSTPGVANSAVVAEHFMALAVKCCEGVENCFGHRAAQLERSGPRRLSV